MSMTRKSYFKKLKIMTPDGVKKIMRLIPRLASVDGNFETNMFASADNIMTSGVQYVDDVEENWFKRNPKTTAAGAAGLSLAAKPVRKAFFKSLAALFGPVGIGLSYPALGALGDEYKFNPKHTADRMFLETELAGASQLTKGALKATRSIKNPLLKKLATKAATISPKLAIRGARVASPLGLYSLLGEASYQMSKPLMKESQRIDAIEDPETQALEMENFVKSIKGYAGGGLTRTVAPDSGPVSQGPKGLAYLKKYGNYS